MILYLKYSMHSSLYIIEKLQDGLNENITNNWKKTRTIDEFTHNCMKEIGEVMNCVPDKWWKHYSDEEKQKQKQKIKLELVDVLHFAISGAIIDRSIDERFMGEPFRKATIEEYANLMRLACCSNFNSIIHQLFILAGLLDFNIIHYYIGKHTLNYIRKLTGYRDGTYTKKNDSLDDNDIILKVLPTLTKKISLDTKLDISEYESTVSNIYDEFDIPEEKRKSLKSYIS